ncbi:MAG: hypothetical protein OEZ22_02630 [Spirochaetia bacterium]|nr:hypothetical protein [Spirochaetia bacterium]
MYQFQNNVIYGLFIYFASILLSYGFVKFVHTESLGTHYFKEVLRENTENNISLNNASNNSLTIKNSNINKIEDIDHSPETFSEYQKNQLLLEDESFLLEGAEPDKKSPFKYKNDDLNLYIYGKNDIKVGYKYTYFIEKEPDDTNSPNHYSELPIDQKSLQVNIKGKIGKKITVDVDYDKDENESKNTFKVQYKALRKREFVQEVTMGNIDLKFPKREFIVFEQQNKKTLGIESKMKRGKLELQAIAALSQGEHNIQNFTGNSKKTGKLISEYEFINRKYYQLEPFTYYDGLTSIPLISAESYNRKNSNSLITLTSNINNAESYTPASVNIDTSSLEIYVDDNNPLTDQSMGAVNKIVNGKNVGNYHLLRVGRDYTFEAKKGRITFITPINEEYSVFVRYSLDGGSLNTTDPSARIENGKIETFIKFGKTIHEDTNHDGTADVIIIDDGKLNLDIYEVRGIYDLATINIIESSFKFKVIKKNFDTVNEMNTLGSKFIDYENGIIYFNLREPFKNLKDISGNFYLEDLESSTIYTENQPSYVSTNSVFSLQFDFLGTIYSYQLEHFNIIPRSEVVKVSGETISPELYYIDYETGFFQFLDSQNPSISSQTPVEVSYDYLPFGAKEQGYIAGVRADYEASKNLRLGSVLLYNGQFEPAEAPQIGAEPVSRLVFDNDIELNLNEEKITKLINTIPVFDFDLLPVQANGYFEYARSFYNQNTFGLALIDDMESSEETRDIPISEKDWVLSAVPPYLSTAVQCDRAPLYYKYYRDPSDFERGLLDFSFTPSAQPPYEKLSGPYNISEGHLESSQLKISQAEKQVSLVMDFDFSKTNSGSQKFAAINTRNYSTTGVDFSNITYFEFYAKLKDTNSLTSGIKVIFDIGVINEDTDSDGWLDNEDIGLDLIDADINQNNQQDANEKWDEGERDGKINRNNNTGKTEDIGYKFNPPDCQSSDTIVGAGPNIEGYPDTKGNTVINTEDFNGNGKLDIEEKTITIDSDSSLNNYLYYENNSSNIISSESWKLVRVYINHASLSDKQKLALRDVKSIRLYITPEAGSENAKGKLLIDTIRFGGTKWRNLRAKRINDSEIEEFDIYDPLIFRAASINNYSSKEEYQENSFLIKERDEWETLHGKKTNTEFASTYEGALKLSYNLQDIYELAYTEQTFIEPLDLEHYEKINVWINSRTEAANSDYFLFRVGSSNNDYYEFTKLISKTGWQKISFALSEPQKTKGNVNLKKINILNVGIKRGTNLSQNDERIIWVNDIFTSGTKIESAEAYKYQASVKILKPLYTTESGVPIISDISTSYKKLHKDSNFSSIGLSEAEKNIEKNEEEWMIQSSLFPLWKADYRYNKEELISEEGEHSELLSQDDYYTMLTHSTGHILNFQNFSLPVINANYVYTNAKNERHEKIAEFISESSQKIVYTEKNYNPKLNITETFPEFFYTKIVYNFETNINLLHQEEVTSIESTDNIFSNAKEKKEKEQLETNKNSLKINIGNFSLAPLYQLDRTVLLKKTFIDDTNYEEVHGNFYFPWFEIPNDFRYRSRTAKYELSSSYNELWIFSPTLKLSADYKETSFKDNPETLELEKFQRQKEPSTKTQLNFSIPLNFKNKLPFLSILESIEPSFSREIIFNEQHVPFTKKTELYDDELGLKRTLPPLAERTYNVIKYPFWYYFQSAGRKKSNYANGRTYVQNNSYEPDFETSYGNAFSIYNNSLSLTENAGIFILWDIWEPLTLRTDTSISQDTKRSSSSSLPIQMVKWNSSLKQYYDLMKIFNFWFWAEKKRRLSGYDFSFTYENQMFITDNKVNDIYAPQNTIFFSWINDENVSKNLSFKFSLYFRNLKYKNYILENPQEDKIIFDNIASKNEKIKEQDTTYEFLFTYQTEWPWLKLFLQNLTSLRLKYHPKYRIETGVSFNRYDYDIDALSKKPSDRYVINNVIDANLHANVMGKFNFLTAYEIIEEGAEKITIEFNLEAKILF